jgi:hypothetical protein
LWQYLAGWETSRGRGNECVQDHAGQFERKRRDPTLETRYEVVIQRADGLERLLEVTSRRVDTPGEPLRVKVMARAIDDGQAR